MVFLAPGWLEMHAREFAAKTWQRVERVPLIPQSCVLYHFYDPRVGAGEGRAVQGNLDPWPDSVLGRRLMLRIATQKGCALKCVSCGAAELSPAVDLTAAHMLEQVLAMLAEPGLNVALLEELQVATFGFGEPTLNRDVPEFLDMVTTQLPGVELVVSTTGPASSLADKCFRALLQTAAALKNVSLQLSVHFLSDAERARFARVKVVSLAVLLARGWEWFAATGRKVLVNLGIGEHFPTWGPDDYAELCRLCSPDVFDMKLSCESPLVPGTPVVDASHMAELHARERVLREAGFTTMIYDPAGRDLGAGCGAQLQ